MFISVWSSGPFTEGPARSFQWGTEEEKALPKPRSSCRLGPRDPADPMVLEVSVTGRDAVWSLLGGPCSTGP